MLRLQEARQLFKAPDVLDKDKMPALNWKAPDVDGLVGYLCHEKQFSEERVRSAIDKMAAAKSKANQNRMESFFKVQLLPPKLAAGNYRLLVSGTHSTQLLTTNAIQVMPSAPKAKLGAKTGVKKKEPASKVKGKVAKKLGGGKK